MRHATWQEGIEFIPNCEVGKDIEMQSLFEQVRSGRSVFAKGLSCATFDACAGCVGVWLYVAWLYGAWLYVAWLNGLCCMVVRCLVVCCMLACCMVVCCMPLCM